MRKLKMLLLLLTISFSHSLSAIATPDEGMWLPLLLKDYNYEEMKRLGCTLTPEQIYSVNNSSIKDAIVSLGGFCTAEVISDEGLLLTNHHCAFDAIASHSSVENDYLTDGFWAASKAEELNVPGLSVSFLIRMEDVTDRIMKKAADYSDEDKSMAIQEEQAAILEELDSKYHGDVETMFDGNAYYLFVYQTFDDIRLVGAPPSAVGKFGGDTDNWMWPRHTGDFSMLRIYADANNDPADYSASNKSYTPKHSLPVSMKGLKKDDFTMIMGYPGRTDRYLTSYELKDHQEMSAPTMVEVMDIQLKIMKAEMDQSDAVRIANASNYASLANGYKYYKGQIRGLGKFDLMAEKKVYEKAMTKWIEADAERKDKYGDMFSDFEKTFVNAAAVSKNSAYINLAGFGPKFIGYGISAWRLQSMVDAGKTDEELAPLIEAIRVETGAHFETYNGAMDKKMFVAMLDILKSKLSESAQLDVFTSDFYLKKAKGSNQKFADLVFSKSILTDQGRMTKALDKISQKKLAKDPGLMYIASVIGMYRSEVMAADQMKAMSLEECRELYMQALQEKESTKNFYPDANFTMRVTYGTVQPYDSWEGKPYETFTYGSQILDKYKAGDEEFDVPAKLLELLKAKDYGPYAVDGKLPVCFLHNTDITGGNSGSPVINGNGELVGVAFDGNWESMTSDLFWQDDYVRTISVDVRYVLFIIDKFAGAQRLLDEMNLVK
jgi:hypothetical protein